MLPRRYDLDAPTESAVRDAMGLYDPQFYRALFPHAAPEVLGEMGAEVERREGEIAGQLGAGILFPGVAGMLERLRGAGMLLCLASTGSMTHVRDMLECAGIDGYFREFRCDAPDKAKMTGELLARHGRSSAAFVGDTEIDVRAARRNGIPVYGAGFGYVKPRERMLFDAVADTPEALCALLLGE